MTLARTVSRSMGDISLSVLRWPETPGSNTLPMNLYTSEKSGVAATQDNWYQKHNEQHMIGSRTDKWKWNEQMVRYPKKKVNSQRNAVPRMHESCATWFLANICCDQPAGELPLKLLLECRPPAKLNPPISPTSGIMPAILKKHPSFWLDQTRSQKRHCASRHSVLCSP
jgi:hypothetical protein